MKGTKFATVDDYIAELPPVTKGLMKQIRKAIREAAPKAVEHISYNIPCFKLDGKGLMWFAAYKNHVSIYPIPVTNAKFKKELAGFKGTNKGTIHFPLDKPVPVGLIKKLVKYRLSEIQK